jgi:hypothetical protein
VGKEKGMQEEEEGVDEDGDSEEGSEEVYKDEL